ncbi:hypothetical protein M3J09_004773 [Ascochyta lentis]
MQLKARRGTDLAEHLRRCVTSSFPHASLSRKTLIPPVRRVFSGDEKTRR